MINVNGVVIIDESTRRLRWDHQVAKTPPPHMVEQWIIRDLWPDKSTRARLRRQIEHGQPTLVLLDREAPVVVIPRENLPTVPIGAIVTDQDDELVTLTVPLLNWLSPTGRDRGLAFATHARRIVAATARPLLPPLLVEDDLIGTNEPLRFAYRTGSIPIVNHLLFDAIDVLYGTKAPTRLHIAGENTPEVGAWPARMAAAQIA